MTEESWLLVKRGLYYRPNDCGYTGIRDHAGRYTADEARARAGSEIKMVRLADAPEFSEACFDDLARAHLVKQRDAALSALETIAEGKGATVAAIARNAVRIARAALTTSQRGTE